MSTKKEYLKDKKGKLFAPIASLDSLNIPDGDLYCNEEDMSFNFKLGSNIIKITDEGKIFCEEVIENDNMGNIPKSNTVYAKIYCTTYDPEEDKLSPDVLVLSSTPDFTYDGELFHDYGKVDNNAYQYNNGGTLRDPIWVDYISEVSSVDIYNPISPTICYSWFYNPNAQDYPNLTEIKNIQNLYTNNVTTMKDMFNECRYVHSLDVSGFDTSNVVDMQNLFLHCNNVSQLDVSDWDTSKVTNMSHMFGFCYSLKQVNVSNWNTSNVTNMDSMFRMDYSLTSLDVSNWDTSNVTNMTYMFDSVFSDEEGLTTIDVSHWDTSKVTDMSFMFGDGHYLEELNVTNWDTSSVTNMRALFYACQSLTYLNVSSWNTSNVTNMTEMFAQCAALGADGKLDLTHWNTSKVTTMESMFDGVQEITSLDLGSFNTSLVTNMSHMFRLSGFNTIIVSDSFVTTNVTNSTDMFLDCGNIVGGNGTTYDSSHIDKTYAHIDGVGGAGYFTILKTAKMISGANFNSVITNSTFANITQVEVRVGYSPYFSNPTKISTEDSDFDIYFSNNSTIGYITTEANRLYFHQSCAKMFKGKSLLTTISLYDVNTSYVTSMQEMFSGCTALTEINGEESWNVSNITNFNKTFYDCNALTSLDVSKWNVKKAKDMSYMFSNCRVLSSIDCNGWNTNSLTNTTCMFEVCWDLQTIDVSKFNVKNVTHFGYMFSNCINLTSLDVSKWDVKNGQFMACMFQNCKELTSLDVDKWNITNLSSAYGMFKGCSKLTHIDINSWNTSKVTDFNEFFSGCTNLQDVYINNIDTSSVQNFIGMFKNCTSLQQVNINNFNINNAYWLYNMFSGCSALKMLDLTNWNPSKVSNVSEMFKSASALTTIYASENFILKDSVTSTDMFLGCTSLIGGNGTAYDSNHIDKEYAKIDKSGQAGYFTEKGELIFDAVSLDFSDGRRVREYYYDDISELIDFPELPENPVYKYSHTPNVLDNGTQNGNYTDDLALNDVITIDGASQIRVIITTSGESTSYDWACVWEGNHSEYTAADNYSSSISGKLGGTTRTKNTYIINGDTVTIGFKSDSSLCGDGYGYYAIITNVLEDVAPEFIINIEEPSDEENDIYFVNWYEDKEFTTLFDLSSYTASTFPRNLTLYAKIYNGGVPDGEVAQNYIIIYS